MAVTNEQNSSTTQQNEVNKTVQASQSAGVADGAPAAPAEAVRPEIVARFVLNKVMHTLQGLGEAAQQFDALTLNTKPAPEQCAEFLAQVAASVKLCHSKIEEIRPTVTQYGVSANTALQAGQPYAQNATEQMQEREGNVPQQSGFNIKADFRTPQVVAEQMAALRNEISSAEQEVQSLLNFLPSPNALDVKSLNDLGNRVEAEMNKRRDEIGKTEGSRKTDVPSGEKMKISEQPIKHGNPKSFNR